MDYVKPKGDLEYVPPDIIDTQWALLRHVENTSLDYQNLKNSIRENGVLETILVRRIEDPVTKTIIISLIDGLHRLTAVKELSLPVIPCTILTNVSDDEALALQIQANLFVIQTRPADFAKAMKLLIDRNRDTMSIPKLAKLTNTSVQYLRELLNIANLPPDVQDLVNEGLITARNAIILAKLPAAEIYDWIETAQKRPKEFKLLAEDRLRELRSHTLKTEETPEAWAPKPLFKKSTAVLAEIKDPKVVKQLVTPGMTPEQAFIEGLRYCLNIDSITTEQRRKEREKLLKEEELRRKEGAKSRAKERIRVLQAELASLQQKVKE